MGTNNVLNENIRNGNWTIEIIMCEKTHQIMSEQTLFRKLKVNDQHKFSLPKDIAGQYTFSGMYEFSINWYCDPDRNILCLGTDKLKQTDLSYEATASAENGRRVVIQTNNLPEKLANKLRYEDYIWGFPTQFDGHPILELYTDDQVVWDQNSSKSPGHTDMEVALQTTKSQAGTGPNNEPVNTAERIDETLESSTSTKSQTDAQESKADSMWLTLPVQTSSAGRHVRGCCQEPSDSPEDDEDIVHYDPSEIEVPF
jgi:hypothetical protein